MPSLLEEIADSLARDVIRASQELRNDDLVNEISKVIGASSPTTQEAFLTAVRVRTAEARARKALAEKLGKSSWDEVVAAMPPPARSEAEPVATLVAPVPQGVPPTLSIAPEARPGPAAAPHPALAAEARPRPVAPRAAPSAASPSFGVGGPVEPELVEPPPASVPQGPVVPRTPVRRVLPRSPVGRPEVASAPSAPMEVSPSSSVPPPTPAPRVAPATSSVGHPDSAGGSVTAPVVPPPLAEMPKPLVAKASEWRPDEEQLLPSGQLKPVEFPPAIEARPVVAAPEPPRDAIDTAPTPDTSADSVVVPIADGSEQTAGSEGSASAPVAEAPTVAPVDANGPERSEPSSEDPRPAEPAPVPPVQHPPGSLAEALARAAAMPKPKVAPAEPKKPVVNPYADIEMPDGDWG